MIEKTIYLEGVDPVQLFGVNNLRFKKIKNQFPGMKIVSRGDALKIQGNEKEVIAFEKMLNMLIDYFQKFPGDNEQEIDLLIQGEGKEIMEQDTGKKNILFYNNTGKPVGPKTVNQRKLIKACRENDLVFAVGIAGTGKTYTAIAMAVAALKLREVKRIILTRPAVEAGEHLGFLPGDYREKLDPYLQPLYDALNDMIPSKRLRGLIEENTIQIAPLAFMRGRTLDHAFVILDEAQNTTVNQLRMFLTRMGRDARFVVTGDLTQIDLPVREQSGLLQAINLLGSIHGISVVKFDARDIIRHPLVKKIVELFRANAKE